MSSAEQPPLKEFFVTVEGARLFVTEKGQGYPLIVLHGGPGLDHHMFGDYLDPLAGRYRLLFVDQRSQGRSTPAPSLTWTLEQMARDVSDVAEGLGLARYAVLGHSYGAFVALQHAVDYPGAASHTIISSGIPSSRYLDHVTQSLAAFEPAEVRERLVISWARERVAQTQDDVAALLHDHRGRLCARGAGPLRSGRLRWDRGGSPAARSDAARAGVGGPL